MMRSPLLCLCLHNSVLLDFAILLDFHVYGITSLLTFGLNQFSLFVCIAGSKASVTFLIKAEIGDSVCLWTVSFFELVAVEKSQCRHVTIYYYFLAIAMPTPNILSSTRAAPIVTAVPFATSLSIYFLMYSWNAKF